jgi:hypothetical protein
MKIRLGFFALLFCFLGITLNTSAMSTKEEIFKGPVGQDSVLRHVVLFKFKAGTTTEQINQVEEAFVALQTKIPEIVSLEWGANNSPEGLDKGFTHCFFLTFRSEADRSTYLPHPDHKAFGSLLGPVLEDVLVVDYWTP